MTDQQSPDPENTAPLPSASSRGDATGDSWSAPQPAPADPTRTAPIPTSEPPAASAPAARARGLSAAVLAGALVLGGAAGVGGAAWYDAWQGPDNASSSTSDGGGGQVTASNASAPAGSVESVAAKVLPSVVKINVTGQSGAGSGSGIILSKDGNILTNNHVVSLAANGGTVTVNFQDGTTKKAKVLGTDPVTDVAVIKAEGVDDLKPAQLGKSSALAVGQQVVAVGSPYGLNSTVTSGIVSALNRPVSVEQEEQQQDPFGGFGFPGQQEQQAPQAQQNLSTTYPAIQTDAAINPGNSGGPLVNMAGQVVGINSSIRTSDSASVSGSGGSIGLGFAIPIDEVLPIVNQLLDGDTPTHARMAVTVSDVSGNTLAQGAQVRSVESGGPAAKAGLKTGDVVTAVDDVQIDGSESLVATIRGHRPGEEVEITYLRDGKKHTTKVTLGSDEKTTAS